jgi:hypothetical protein
MFMIGFAFAASWTTVTAMAVHLPRLLEAAGASTVQAVAAGGANRPSQVGARLFEASEALQSHAGCLWPCIRLVRPCWAHLVRLRPPVSSWYCTVQAAASHHCVSEGTAGDVGPRELRLGLLGAPSRIMMAASPRLFGILIDLYGAGALIFSSTLSIAAFAGLCSLRISKAAIK